MFCPFCAVQLGGAPKFCPSCGQNVGFLTQLPSTPSTLSSEGYGPTGNIPYCASITLCCIKMSHGFSCQQGHNISTPIKSYKLYQLISLLSVFVCARPCVCVFVCP